MLHRFKQSATREFNACKEMGSPYFSKEIGMWVKDSDFTAPLSWGVVNGCWRQRWEREGRTKESPSSSSFQSSISHTPCLWSLHEHRGIWTCIFLPTVSISTLYFSPVKYLFLFILSRIPTRTPRMLLRVKTLPLWLCSGQCGSWPSIAEAAKTWGLPVNCPVFLATT